MLFKYYLICNHVIFKFFGNKHILHFTYQKTGGNSLKTNIMLPEVNSFCQASQKENN